MKFNIAYPINGTQKTIEIDDERRCAVFFDKRMGAEVLADTLGDDYKGYVFKIMGGFDKDGFPMKQGILVKGRISILMSEGHKCYRPKRKGERKRKGVRGCIVGADIRVLHLIIIKKGEKDIEGITNAKQPRRLGPKRANKLKKLFALKKDDDVRRFVVRRVIEREGKRRRTKAPKIQRLVTDIRLRRKRIYKLEKKNRFVRTKKATEEYAKIVGEWRKKVAAKKEADLAHAQSLAAAHGHPAPATKTATPAQPVKGGKAAPATTAKGAQPATTAKGAQPATAAKGAQPATAAKGAQPATQAKGQAPAQPAAAGKTAPKAAATTTTAAPAQKAAPAQAAAPAQKAAPAQAPPKAEGAKGAEKKPAAAPKK